MVRKPIELLQSPESRAQLAALTERVSNLIDTVKEGNKKSDDHRDRLTNVLDAIGEAMRALTNRFESLQPLVTETAELVEKIEPIVTSTAAKVADMQEPIEDYKQKRAEAKGRAKLGHALHVLWLTIAGAVVALFTWLVSGGKPHP